MAAIQASIGSLTQLLGTVKVLVSKFAREQPVDRSNEGLLRPIERPLLEWFCVHLPSAVSSDHLTAIGVLGACIAAVFYPLTAVSHHFIWIASFGVALNWFGDSLDGTIARYRNKERPRYGFFLDVTADLISQILIGIGFGLMPYIALSSSLLVLTVYLVFASHTFIRTIVFNQFVVAYFNTGPTEVRIALIVLGLLLAYIPILSHPLIFRQYALSDIGAVAMAIAGYAAFLVQSYREWRILSKEV